jgi:formamidopyrimidine-DNA glycosylase
VRAQASSSLSVLIPSVCSARAVVEAKCRGKVIKDVKLTEQGGGPRTGLFDEIIFCNSNEAEARKAFVGRTLLQSCRKGKQMYWLLSGPGLQPTLHLGMTGWVSIEGQGKTEFMRYAVDTANWPPKFTKAEFTFSDGTRLAFTDPRRLARIKLVKDPLKEAPVSELAPDALLEMPDQAGFDKLLQRNVPIKALLLDQNGFLAGIGNYLADEVLYQSAIHPETAAWALRPAESAALRSNLIAIIKHAVKVNAESDKFPKSWLFHYRWGKGKGKAVDHEGRNITFVTVGGRTSAVVSAVQGAPRKMQFTASASSSSSASGSSSSSSSATATTAVATSSKRGRSGIDASVAAATAVAAPSRKRKQEAADESVSPAVAAAAAAPARTAEKRALTAVSAVASVSRRSGRAGALTLGVAATVVAAATAAKVAVATVKKEGKGARAALAEPAVPATVTVAAPAAAGRKRAASRAPVVEEAAAAPPTKRVKRG